MRGKWKIKRVRLTLKKSTKKMVKKAVRKAKKDPRVHNFNLKVVSQFFASDGVLNAPYIMMDEFGTAISGGAVGLSIATSTGSTMFSGSTQGFSTTTTIGDVMGVADLGTKWKQYRINSVKIKITRLMNNQGLLYSGSGITGTQEFAPQLTWNSNPTNANWPITTNQLLDEKGVKVFTFKNAGSSKTITFKPKISAPIYGGLTNAYQAKNCPFINLVPATGITVNPTLYGFRGIFSGLDIGTPIRGNGAFRFDMTYNVDLKDFTQVSNL